MELLEAEDLEPLSRKGVWPVGEFSIAGLAIGTSRAATLVPALTPRRLAGRSKVHATSKSTQFWHRPSESSLRLHLMLRLLQKSPKRQYGQLSRLTSGDPPSAKWSRVHGQRGGRGVLQALETRWSFRGFCDIQSGFMPTRSQNWI